MALCPNPALASAYSAPPSSFPSLPNPFFLSSPALSSPDPFPFSILCHLGSRFRCVQPLPPVSTRQQLLQRTHPILPPTPSQLPLAPAVFLLEPPNVNVIENMVTADRPKVCYNLEARGQALPRTSCVIYISHCLFPETLFSVK